MLVHITDQLTDWRYLVGAGASFSLVHHRSGATLAKEPRLIGPNGLPIRCWGEERRRLRFGGRTFEWDFLRADVSFPIQGVDFLCANKLLVDVACKTLVDFSTGNRFSLTGRPSGHTASIMLPANLGAHSPTQAGPRAIYAPVLPHKRPQHRTHQPDTSQTPGTSGGRRRRSQAGSHSGPFSGRAQPGDGAASDIIQGGPLPQPLRAADPISVPAAGYREVSGGEEGVPRPGSSGGSATLHKPVGIPPAHGEEGGRVLAAMWQLPPPQRRHRPRHIHHPEHDGLHYYVRRLRLKGYVANLIYSGVIRL